LSLLPYVLTRTLGTRIIVVSISCENWPRDPSIFQNLLNEISLQLENNGFQLLKYQGTVSAQQRLIQILENLQSTAPILFLIDELQVFFTIQKDELYMTNTENFFKELCSPAPSRRRINQFFALSGSGLLLAFQAFTLASPADHLFANELFFISMSSIVSKENKKALQTLCSNELRQHFGKSVPDKIYQMVKRLDPPTQSHFCCRAALYFLLPDPISDEQWEQFKRNIEMKYREEFLLNVGHLMDNLSSEIRKEIRKFAMKDGNPLTLDQVFPGRVKDFFSPLLHRKANGNYYFENKLVRRLMRGFVKRDGWLSKQIPSIFS